MKTRFLFPHNWQLPGSILIAISILLMGLNYFSTGAIISSTNFDNISTMPTSVWIEIIKNNITYISIISGLLIIGFSKETIEDEQIAQLRLDSLQWAIYVNYFIFILCILFTYGMHFLSIIIYNTITPLIFFIIRFRWKIYQLNKGLTNVGGTT